MCSKGYPETKKWNHLTCNVLDASLEFELPVVDVLDPLSQLLGDVVLGAIGPGRAVAYQLLGLVANSEKKKYTFPELLKASIFQRKLSGSISQ